MILEAIGFARFKDTLELKSYDKYILDQAIDEITEHIISIGGCIKLPDDFDATKSSITSTISHSQIEKSD